MAGSIQSANGRSRDIIPLCQRVPTKITLLPELWETGLFVLAGIGRSLVRVIETTFVLHTYVTSPPFNLLA